MKEAIRWLIVVIAVAAMFYTFGRMHSWQGSVDRAGYDCNNYKMFSVDEIDYACYKLTGSKDKYGRD